MLLSVPASCHCDRCFCHSPYAVPTAYLRSDASNGCCTYLCVPAPARCIVAYASKMRCMMPTYRSMLCTITFGAYRTFGACVRSIRAVRNHFFLLMDRMPQRSFSRQSQLRPPVAPLGIGAPLPTTYRREPCCYRRRRPLVAESPAVCVVRLPGPETGGASGGADLAPEGPGLGGPSEVPGFVAEFLPRAVGRRLVGAVRRYLAAWSPFHPGGRGNPRFHPGGLPPAPGGLGYCVGNVV
jgi:hypothetical protein